MAPVSNVIPVALQQGAVDKTDSRTSLCRVAVEACLGALSFETVIPFQHSRV